MASTTVVSLDRAEEDLIHEQSILSLETIGVRIPSPSVLEMLEEKGARVDCESMVARLPEKLVLDALASAPAEFVLCGRDPSHDLKLPAATFPYAASTGLAVHIADPETGAVKDTDLDDLATFTRLADALDGVDLIWPALTAHDVDSSIQTFCELWTTLQNTTKHVMGDVVHGAEHAKLQVDLVAMIAGGRDALRQRPLFSALICPIAPLSFEQGAIEAHVELARSGIPVVCLSMSLGGLTAPVTVAGMIVNANTENLASLVVSQSACPGAPHIYGSDSTPLNPQTGVINYRAVENPLISSALAQMAKRYGLPSLVGQCGNEMFSQGNTSLVAFCDCVGNLLASLNHSDLTVGLGGTDTAKGACYKQLVYDAYTWELCRAFGKRAEISKETIALDLVREVGHGRELLTHKHTAKNFRKELTLWDEEKHALLAIDDFERLSDALRAVVTETLRTHRVPGLDEAIVERGNEMIRGYEERWHTRGEIAPAASR